MHDFSCIESPFNASIFCSTHRTGDVQPQPPVSVLGHGSLFGILAKESCLSAVLQRDRNLGRALEGRATAIESYPKP